MVGESAAPFDRLELPVGRKMQLHAHESEPAKKREKIVGRRT